MFIVNKVTAESNHNFCFVHVMHAYFLAYENQSSIIEVPSVKYRGAFATQ